MVPSYINRERQRGHGDLKLNDSQGSLRAYAALMYVSAATFAYSVTGQMEEHVLEALTVKTEILVFLLRCNLKGAAGASYTMIGGLA